MSLKSCLAVLPVVLVAASASLASESEGLDEVVEKSLAALGGKAAWDAIETLELTGTYSTFSSEKPFVIRRQRPNLYRFDHQQADMPVTVGFDGHTVWWENQTPFAEVSWPMVVPQAYRRGYEADAEFEPPYLDAEAKGHRVTFHGRTRFEGQEALELEVTLKNGLNETWYLDPETYLPSVRISKAGFKVFEAENLVFLSDYRPVAGALMPHHVENEVDNLVSVMEVAKVQVNVEHGDVFRLPGAPVMARLEALAGRWEVRVSTRMLPVTPWVEDRAISTIEPRFDRRVLEENIAYLSVGQPRQVRRLYSHDRFRDALRVVQIDDLTAHPMLLEGDPTPERLVVTNLETGTDWQHRGQTIHDRLVFYDIGADAFKVDQDRSTDGGASWVTFARFEYTRADAPRQ